ncbi:arabinosyltransferase XEG113 [Tanacetum coccineum]
MLVADDKIWDQNGFNDLVQTQVGPAVDDESGLVYAYDGSLKLGLLPASIFCSGHTYFVQAMYQQLRLEAYVVHTTFQYAGLKESVTDYVKLWFSSINQNIMIHQALNFVDLMLPNASRGFLTFKPSVPKSLLLDGKHNLETHFTLVNYQQIRTALAIASLLNRTLVMPPLWCRFDRLWFPHPTVLLGLMTRQPFICPLDHVFERDDLEEGEIAMSGDIHVNLQKSGSLNHDHDENKDEHTHADRKPVQESNAYKHDQSNRSSKGKQNPPKGKIAGKETRTNPVSAPSKDALEHTKARLDVKVNNGSGPFSGATMTEAIQRRCKNVIPKIQRRIDKEGLQIMLEYVHRK